MCVCGGGGGGEGDWLIRKGQEGGGFVCGSGGPGGRVQSDWEGKENDISRLHFFSISHLVGFLIFCL